MRHVVVRGPDMPTTVLRPGERLAFGRAPHQVAGAGAPALSLPGCAPHVSRLVGVLAVTGETVTLHWSGASEAQLSSLFDAPGGARRVVVSQGTTVTLDAGENQLLLLRGKQSGADLRIDVEIVVDPLDHTTHTVHTGWSGDPTAASPALPRHSREWYVALALCEPWLTGADDYPRPPSNREIHDRVLAWHGYAWNLVRPQRVDDALRLIAAVAFGPDTNPFTTEDAARKQHTRFAVARRAAEVRLVTPADLAEVERARRSRR
ncbi:hypothetical protein [Saccharothrix sp. NRRL B-16314]|uniref:hypothetical protein n=1 Tax=Saccharothrix sp. NRRL B-16314 TaxID=1463825 RepID=UPI000A4F84F4|nr:hypothetical protein [Saccharothrix sp. NRRL B-16314]